MFILLCTPMLVPCDAGPDAVNPGAAGMVWPEVVDETADRKAVERLKRMNLGEMSEFIMGLPKAGNMRLLRKLYTDYQGWGFSSYAAFVAVKTVPDGEVVAFCRQFKTGSDNWETAFSMLEHRPKAVVMPYIKAVCATGNARVRYDCYDLCQSAGWDDLLEQARADVSNQTVVLCLLPGLSQGDVPLSLHAKFYVERFDKKK